LQDINEDNGKKRTKRRREDEENGRTMINEKANVLEMSGEK
jgi:hypothetical protein